MRFLRIILEEVEDGDVRRVEKTIPVAEYNRFVRNSDVFRCLIDGLEEALDKEPEPVKS